jgi:putative transposase
VPHTCVFIRQHYSRRPGYNDYDWYNQLTRKRHILCYTPPNQRAVPGNQSPIGFEEQRLDQRDQTIRLTSAQATKKCPHQLRRIGYWDIDTGKYYIFLTNNFKLTARTIADIYKTRWQVELFFKWIKQNLKIKSFIGTSKTMQQILRLLQLNFFEKYDLMALLRGDSPDLNHSSDIQMILL